MKKIHALMLAVIFTAVSFTACGSDKSTENKDTTSISTQVNSNTNTTLKTANKNSATSTKSTASTNEINDNIQWKASLYFPDNNLQYVTKSEKNIEISKDTGELTIEKKAEICLEELANGGITAIPRGTKVLSVTKSNDMLTVDFSNEFVTNMNGGSSAINMMMSQIVLTLTELNGVNQVSIKVDGKVIDEYKGHIELNRPFKRSEYENLTKKGN